MDIKERLAEWGINAIAAAASMVGGLIAITMNDKEISFRSAMAQILCAVGFAGFGAELFAKWLRLDAMPSVCGLLGLVLGLCGLFIAKGVLKIGKKFEKNPEAFIKKGGGDASN